MGKLWTYKTAAYQGLASWCYPPMVEDIVRTDLTNRTSLLR